MPLSVRSRSLLAGLLVAMASTTLVGCDPAEPTHFGLGDCQPAPPYYPAPCGSLATRIKSLRAGDVLLIEPGTYAIGKLRIDDVQGTALSRITVKAQDPSNRPLLKGWLSMWGADYVTFDSLRFEATETTSNNGTPAGGLSFVCGVGWTVKNSELFGASNTQSTWNLAISGHRSGTGPDNCPNEPRAFTVQQNIFRLPYTEASDAAIYHHIYASFEGDSGTSGTITRNLFHGFKNGAGVKLGAATTQCARNVVISFNTFYDGARAIVMEDDVRGNLITGNLMDQIRYNRSINPHIPVALGNVINTPPPANVISHTYAANNANHNHLLWGPILDEFPGILTDGGDNLFRSGGDHLFNSIDPTVPGSFQPANNAAKLYGRYGTGNFP